MVKINRVFPHITALLFRLFFGGLMLTHGIPKLQNLLTAQEVSFPDPLGVGAVPSLILTIFSEVVCAGLLVLGLATRLASIPLIITMLVIVFIVHLNDGLSGQELPLLYLIGYLGILLLGPGKYSIDYLRK
ncbi:MAG: DoxX family protein [Mesonia hippocampi]|uniref:DoxX family protein n=1 Tax=Mesonia hippocampi TaxID=1628250 RepID=UPI003F967871